MSRISQSDSPGSSHAGVRDESHDESHGAETVVTAIHDTRLVARIVRRVSMTYADGADARLDRPAFVRAASGIAWVGNALAVAQDDANFVAIVDPADGSARAITLPAGHNGLRQFDDGRGNKSRKLDIEALAHVWADGTSRLIALGSGSRRRRDWLVLIEHLERAEPAMQLFQTSTFHERMREAERFSGSELNVEGAVQCGDMLRILNRGNGAPNGDVHAIDATCEVNWRALLAHANQPDSVAPPELMNIQQYNLGALDGVRLTFTDATLAHASIGTDVASSGYPMFYTAAAEASPDASCDGDVSGSAIGIVRYEAQGTNAPPMLTARHVPLLGEDGSLSNDKVEGIALHPERHDRLYVVVDVDTHDRPSELCEVELVGPWY